MKMVAEKHVGQRSRKIREPTTLRNRGGRVNEVGKSVVGQMLESNENQFPAPLLEEG